ncbi:hypothetical protein ACIQWR_39795 [Streptomyces sp. NPDC098789]|uniref:hypothetical protein n=1 Tax=Streptomyces sp. NPDC098789 TaxID=3366098 RepID=UPI0037F22A65
MGTDVVYGETGSGAVAGDATSAGAPDTSSGPPPAPPVPATAKYRVPAADGAAAGLGEEEGEGAARSGIAATTTVQPSRVTVVRSGTTRTPSGAASTRDRRGRSTAGAIARTVVAAGLVGADTSALNHSSTNNAAVPAGSAAGLGALGEVRGAGAA